MLDRRLRFALLASALLAACSNDELARLPDAEIEVIGPDGTAERDADPWLSIEFPADSGGGWVVRTIEVASVGQAALRLTATCLVAADDLASALALPCIDSTQTPFLIPDAGQLIPPGKSERLALAYAPDLAGPLRLFFRIESNALESKVALELLAVPAPVSPTVDAPWVISPESPVDQTPCSTTTSVTPEEVTLPADILWVVDSSCSMDGENVTVQDNLNAFSSRIGASRIDHHVILIGNAAKISVPPPLGGSPFFLMIDQPVDSNEPLLKILEMYPAYQSFLRAGSVKHIVAVTDDESSLRASDFTAQLNQLSNPGFAPRWIFHSIVAYGAIPIIGCYRPPRGGDAIGHQYLALSMASGGITFQICERDWTPVLDAIVNAVETSSNLSCEIPLATPPSGKHHVPDTAQLEVSLPGVPPMALTRVASAADCTALGWYLDDPQNPTKAILCPAACDTFRNQADRAVVTLDCR